MVVHATPIRIPISATIYLLLNVFLILSKLHLQKMAEIGSATALVIIDMLAMVLERPKMKRRFSVKSQSAG